jgi:hypothetical protein
LKRTFHIAALLWLAAFSGARFSVAAQRSPASQPDGIFTPTISPVASIDKTGHPTTVEVSKSEPRLAQSMLAGTPAGDSYVINFPNSTGGGPCIYTGTARYLINGSGTLTFQVLANCGNLRRGYSYMICNMDASLRCKEAPWWYFRDRTYIITNEGVAANGSAPIPWQDATEAPQLLQNMSEKIKALNERYRQLAAPNTIHGRSISCREFHPETKSYHIWDFSTACLIKSVCDGMPNLDQLRDGDLIDWNSPAGSFVKKQSKATDFANWVCWIRTQ